MTTTFLMAIVAAVAFGVGGIFGVWAGLSIANEPSEISHGGYQPKSDVPLDPLKLKPPGKRSTIGPRVEVKPQSIRYPRETS